MAQASRVDCRFNKRLVLAPVLLLFFLCLIVGSCHAQRPPPAPLAHCNAADSAALLKFKAGLGVPGNPSTTSLSSWVNGSNCCAWVGVTCGSTGRVTALGLDFDQTITPAGASALGSLEELVSLAIFGLIFDKTIPAAWAQLTNLQVLTLGGGVFGPFPVEIWSLPSLTTLQLTPPPGGYTLPVESCRLSNIEFVTISPGLTGTIPDCIGNWTKVQSIQLSNNNLTGRLPPSLGTLSTLTTLSLTDNFLYGPIPPSFGGLRSLQTLDIINNFLSGPLPKELGLLQNLQTMQFTTNRIWGTIPPEIGNMSSLWLLDISSNDLWGNLPDSIGRMPALIDIELGNNNLYGTLPEDLGFAPNLFNLHMDNNRFWGRIPSSIVNNVSDIRLDNNYFSGPLPYDGVHFDESRNENVISIANNRLTGGIPLYLMTRGGIDFHGNRLSITKPIGRLPANHSENILSIYLSHNDFSGPIPSWLYEGRTRLEFLDLSFNKFSGPLPDGLFSLPQILNLNLASNWFTSRLPASPFSNVLKIFTQSQTGLNLSHNAIYGDIPASFFGGIANFLVFLDVSHNQLSGTLEGISNLTAKDINYLSFANNHLTGSIPASVGSLFNLDHLDLSNNDLSGTIPESVLHLVAYENFSGNANLTGA